MEYRYGSHTVNQIEYHVVWVTKYRYKVLSSEIAERIRDLVRQTCEAFEIRIINCVASKDHVHILVSAPPNLAPSEIMRRIKGHLPSSGYTPVLFITPTDFELSVRGVSALKKSDIGENIFGHAGIFVPPLGR